MEGNDPGVGSSKANASGRNEAALRTFLESHYKENMSEEEGVHLVLSCLLEVCVKDGNES